MGLCFDAAGEELAKSEQFTNVQRGIIFMYLVFSLFFFIVVGVRLVAGIIDPQDQKYEEGKQNKAENSEMCFEREVMKSQELGQDDKGSEKFGKKVARFETMLFPLIITFVFNLSLGVTYAFCFVLFFFTLVPLILFNMLGLQKKMCSHRVFLAIADNMWLLLSFFWLLNIWTTGKFMQPYYLQDC